MFLSADTMRVILELGLSQDQTVALYAALERDFRSVESVRPSAPDSARDRKRAADRARIKAKRDADKSHATSRDIGRDNSATHSATSAATPSDIESDSPRAPIRAQVVNPSLPSLRSEELYPLTEPSVPSPAKPKRLKGKASRRCPEDWMPNPGHVAIADELKFSAEECARFVATFRDHEFKTPKTDWDAAFRNWLRNSTGGLGYSNGTGTQPRSRWQLERERKTSQLIEGTLDFVNRGRGCD